MSFRVDFESRSRPVQTALVGPDPVGDYETDVIEACSALAEGSAGTFVLSGCGRDPWPLDVAYDMSAFMEQFPDLLTGVRAGVEVEVDLYPQGVECSLVFRPDGDRVDILCVSRTTWHPDPETEGIARDELVTMLEQLARTIATSLQAAAPRLAAVEPFSLWRENVF